MGLREGRETGGGCVGREGRAGVKVADNVECDDDDGMCDGYAMIFIT